MKRILLTLIPASMILSSCGLLNMALNRPVMSTPGGKVVNPVSSVVSPMIPNHRNLQAVEDRGTGLYGYLNEFGAWVIPPTYVYAVDFDKEMGLAVVSPQSGFWGAINVHGQTVIDFKFNSRYDVQGAISSMREGRYLGIDLWPMYDRNTELYGFLDYYGNWFIEPQFRYVCDMSNEGYAVVQFMDDMWGVIDRSCRIIVQPNFHSRYDASDALKAILRR